MCVVVDKKVCDRMAIWVSEIVEDGRRAGLPATCTSPTNDIIGLRPSCALAYQLEVVLESKIAGSLVILL